jgi:hypothetical protein
MVAVPTPEEMAQRLKDAAEIDVHHTNVAKVLMDPKCVECGNDLTAETAEECTNCGHTLCWDQCYDEHVCKPKAAV